MATEIGPGDAPQRSFLQAAQHVSSDGLGYGERCLWRRSFIGLSPPIVSQPNPFSENGDTVVVPRTEVEIEEEPGIGLAIVPEAVTLADVVSGLNALGVGPRDMIDILKAIKAAGALHAEFVVQ
jgi:hypothetical protein